MKKHKMNVCMCLFRKQWKEWLIIQVLVKATVKRIRKRSKERPNDLQETLGKKR